MKSFPTRGRGAGADDGEDTVCALEETGSATKTNEVDEVADTFPGAKSAMGATTFLFLLYPIPTIFITTALTDCYYSTYFIQFQLFS